jgi:hypothetical protein
MKKRRRPLLAIINKIQDQYLPHRFRKIWIRFIKIFLPKYIDKEQNNNVRQLLNNDYLILPQIDADIVGEIKNIAETNLLMDPWDPKIEYFLKKDKPPGITVARLVNPAEFRVIQILASKIEPLKLSASYFGCKCVIDSVDIWWSFPSDGDPFQAENFHRDRDSSEFLKWFVYLTDVNEFSGPHELALGSLNSGKYTKGYRYKDYQIYDHFKTKKFFGIKGTNFIENTYSLHRGYKPKKGERLLFQVRYSIHGSSFRYREKKLPNNFTHDALNYSYIN